MKKIISMERTSSAFPEQYQGTLDTEELFYIRIRFGHAELRVGNKEQWDKWDLPVVSSMDWDQKYKGEFQGDELTDLMSSGGVVMQDDLEIREDPHRALEMLEKLKNLMEEARKEPKEKTVREEAMFLTLDEDILHGKISGRGEKELMESARRYYKITPTNLENES